MINWYKFGAVTAMVTVALIYIIRFCSPLFDHTAEDFAIWGQLGDYMGGILNPVLSFVSITLLIRSVTLQNQANIDLREELKENKRVEKLRSFGILFFNMIDEQKSLLNDLSYTTRITPILTEKGVGAIRLIEDEVELLRDLEKSNATIKEFLLEIDSNERIYDLVRAFYVIVKIVSDKLSDSNGFSLSERREYFETLISFTNFSQIRLIMMMIQFMSYPPALSLRDHAEFMKVISERGLELDPY